MSQSFSVFSHSISGQKRKPNWFNHLFHIISLQLQIIDSRYTSFIPFSVESRRVKAIIPIIHVFFFWFKVIISNFVENYCWQVCGYNLSILNSCMVFWFLYKNNVVFFHKTKGNIASTNWIGNKRKKISRTKWEMVEEKNSVQHRHRFHTKDSFLAKNVRQSNTFRTEFTDFIPNFVLSMFQWI